MSKKKATKFLIQKTGKIMTLLIAEGLMACGESWLRERKRKNYETIKDQTGCLRNRIVTEVDEILVDDGNGNIIKESINDIESDFELL